MRINCAFPDFSFCSILTISETTAALILTQVFAFYFDYKFVNVETLNYIWSLNFKEVKKVNLTSAHANKGKITFSTGSECYTNIQSTNP